MNSLFNKNKPATSDQSVYSVYKNTNNAVVADVYDSVAHNYEQFISKAQYGMPKWLGPRIVKYAQQNPVVIDLACGHGLVGKLLKDHQVEPAQLHGYDISSQMIQVVKNSQIYTTANICNLEFGLPGVAALSTNIVTAFGLMEFLEDELTILHDVARILKLDGELFCSFEAIDKSMSCEFDFVELTVGNKKLIRRRRSRDSIINLLTTAGLGSFDIKRTTGYVSPTSGQKVDYFFVAAMRERL